MTGPSGRANARGAALLLALAALVILGALGTALGTSVLRGIATTREAGARDELLNVAESGIDLALSKLLHDPSWAAAEAMRVPGGECTVTARQRGDGVIEITSHAVAEPRPGRKAGVRVEVRRTADGRFALAAWQQIK